MQIKDVFPEIFTGVNLNIGNSKEESTREIYTLIKDSIQYTNIIEKKLVKKIVNVDIKDKYKMSDRDIIISLKKPYKVGTFRFIYHKEIIIPNNFAILRNINRDKYSYIFVANYLERIGIAKYIQEHPERKNEDLSISEIKEIELPDISKEEQMRISELVNNINERSALYNNLLENDEEIIKYALNEVIGGKNV